MAVKKNPGIINYEQLAFQHPTPFSIEQLDTWKKTKGLCFAYLTGTF